MAGSGKQRKGAVEKQLEAAKAQIKRLQAEKERLVKQWNIATRALKSGEDCFGCEALRGRVVGLEGALELVSAQRDQYAEQWAAQKKVISKLQKKFKQLSIAYGKR